jgi:hypothetical protein
MSILTRLFGSKNRSPPPSDKPPTLRSLMKARTPPWHRVPPVVIDAIFEALDDTELFDCFVRSSMENNLVSKYERLGREDENVSIIRSRLSGILCQTGFQEIVNLQRELTNRRIEQAKKVGSSAIDLFEPAIAISKDQIDGLRILGVKAKSQEYAKLGLFELEKVKQSAAGQAIRESAVFPADMLESAEHQLRGYLSAAG